MYPMSSRPGNIERRSINSLPPELLVIIFSLVPGCPSALAELADVDAPFDEARVSLRRTEDLWPIFFTCRRWMHICLNTPHLWSTITFDSCAPSPRRIPPYKHMFKCPSGPQYVLLKGGPSEEASRRVREFSARVNTLCCQDIVLNATTECGSLGVVSLPQLRVCELACTASGQLPRRTAPLFPNSAALRVLRLTRPPFIPSNSFPALTHLQIDTIVGAPVESNTPTVGDLVTFLSLLPKLQVLELIHVACGLSPSVDGWPDGQLQLTNLARFSSEEPAAEGWGASARRITKFRDLFFSHTSFPHSCAIHLGWARPDQLRQFAAVLPLGARRAARARISRARNQVSAAHPAPGARVLLELTSGPAADAQRWSFGVQTLYPDDASCLARAASMADHVARQLAGCAAHPMFAAVEELELDGVGWLVVATPSPLASFLELKVLVVRDVVARETCVVTLSC